MYAMNWQSIREKVIKIKQYTDNNNEVIFTLIFIISVFTAFGLGRLSIAEELHETIVMRSAPISTKIEPLNIGGGVVASRNGTKYHAPWCSGASRINEENKIWFENEVAAKVAGYTPAKNCKGLK